MQRSGHSVLLRWAFFMAAAVLLSAQSPTSGLAEHPGSSHARPIVDPDIVAYVPNASVSGYLTIAGSDTMQPILSKLATAFRQSHPQAKIAVQGESADLSIREAFLTGIGSARRGDGKTTGHGGSSQVQLLALSRELSKEELMNFFERNGYKPTAIPIAQDAIAVYIHHDNPLQGLTLEQVDAMFGKTRKRGLKDDIGSWGQLGLTGEWEHHAIHLYGRDKRSSGTRPFFKDNALLDGDFKTDIREEAGPASLVLAIAANRLAVGYSGIGFRSSGVRAVPIAEKAGLPFVEPSFESVIGRTYPLARQLYLYLNKPPDQPISTFVLEFLKFVNSQAGQTIITNAGNYPLTASQVNRNLQILSNSSMASARGTTAVN